MTTPVITKTCLRCSNEKALDDFHTYNNGGSSRGFRNSCKECSRQANRTNYLNKSEEYRAKHRDYTKTHREKRTAYTAAYYHKNKERQREYNRTHYHKNKERLNKARLKYEYGLTPAEYDAMYSTQGGACAICRQVCPLCVDHNHETGKVRALLCRMCNAAIGFLDDSSIKLQAALTYIQKYEDRA